MPTRSVSFAILLGSTVLTTLPVSAQDSIVLDPIVLSAGAPKVASEVPQSVTVVDKEGLDEIAAENIGDVLATVPGVAGTGSGAFFGQGFNIRGFGTPSSAGMENGILQLVDGEKKYYESYRQGALFVEPDFLKRVEVLRGPGSTTLYGSGALGGVIAMETIDAGDVIPDGATSGGRVKLSYGTNPDNLLTSLAWGWRPTDDFQALAALAWRKQGDLEDANGNTIIRTNSRTPNVLLKARKDMGEHYVEASYQHLEADGDDQDFNQLDGAISFPWGVGDITTRDQTGRLVWGWNPADNRLVDITVTLSYTNTMKDVRQGNVPSEPVFPSLLNRRDYALWRLKAENVADLSGEGYNHTLTLGAEIFRQDRSGTPPSSSHPEGYTKSAAIYGFSQIEWDRLTVNTGLRLEKQRTEPKSSANSSIGRVDAEAVEPQIALMYKLNDDWSVFGSLAAVSRLPTVDELYDGFMGGGPSPDLKPEKARNIEIGLSYSGMDVFAAGDEAAMKLTVFRNHIDDMIARSGSRVPTEPAWVNIDKARLKGGELEASYARNGFVLGAAYSMVRGEDQDGVDLDSLPNDRLTLSASWQVNDSWKIGARSTFAKGVKKPDGTFRGMPVPGEYRAGYGVHDIFATWTPAAAPQIAVNLGVDNVTNKQYIPATYTSTPAPGRNVKISLTRQF